MPARRPKTTAPPGTLPHRLHFVRIVARFTQAELSAEIGTTRSALAKYESGRMVIPWSVGWAWCRRLDINLRWLATGEEPQGPYIAPEEMGVDVAALEAASQEGEDFPDAYARLVEKQAEKWHRKTPPIEITMRLLRGGPEPLMRRLSWKELRAMIKRFADEIGSPTGDSHLFAAVTNLSAAVAEIKNRVREKHPHFAKLL
jgi:transcriptional regulator with XRE-family HTH domain